MQLRPKQVECLSAIREHYENGTARLLVILPTGTGKTVVFSQIPKWFPGKRTLVIAHTEELVGQAADKMRHWNPTLRVGVEMADRRCSGSDDVVCASVATLGREGTQRLAQLDPKEFGALVIDEAHHAVADSYKRIVSHFGFGEGGEPDGRLLLGVTATSGRGDGQGLAQVFDRVAFQYSMLESIRDGYLCPPRGYRVRTGVSLDTVHTTAGDFQVNELAGAINTPARNKLVVKEWLNHGEDRQSVAFCADVQHAKDLADAFRSEGISADAIWGVDPDRESKLRAHRDRRLRVLCNCAVLTEGYDDWQLGCIILARPTKSKLLFTQMVGRGARLPQGIDNLVEARKAGVALPKEDFIVLDVTDNSGRHSLISLPSIFGLPPNLDLKGRTVVQAIDEIEAAEMARPDVDFSTLENLEDLQSYVERVDLFEVKFDPEVEANSELQWHKTPKGNYLILLPKGERVTITQNLLGHWDIHGTVQGKTFEDSERELGAAFSSADNLIRLFGRTLMSMLRRVASGRKAAQPITPAQVNAIRGVLNMRNKPVPDFTRMTMHDGAALLRKLFTQREAV